MMSGDLRALDAAVDAKMARLASGSGAEKAIKKYLQALAKMKDAFYLLGDASEARSAIDWNALTSNERANLESAMAKCHAEARSLAGMI